MSIRRIVRYGNPILRQKSERIEVFDEELSQLAADMVKAMREGEGIGLAAPQVAKSISMFVIDMGLITDDGKPMAVINPEIVQSEGQISIEEGCLCFPDVREEIKRPEIIRVKYQDLNGAEHEEEFGGYKSRVFQHEIDHLNGVLFIDHLGPMKRRLLHKRLKQIEDEEQVLMQEEQEP
jgi:peptide deformylase